MKKILILVLCLFVNNSCLAQQSGTIVSYTESSIQFTAYDGESNVIYCYTRITWNEIVRGIDVYFIKKDLSENNVERIRYFSWSVSGNIVNLEDITNLKTEADIPIGGCFQNGLFSFFDKKNNIFTFDVSQKEFIWVGHSDTPIANIALSDSLIYVAKKNGELVIYNNLNGANIKRIKYFSSSIETIKINPKNNLLAIITKENKAFICKKDSLLIIDSIVNCMKLDLHSKSEVIYSSKENLLFLYDFSKKKTVTSFDYFKPENSSIISIMSCPNNYFVIELDGLANTLKIINKFSGATVRDFMMNESLRAYNYGGSLIGYYNNKIIAISGDRIYWHDISDIMSIKQDAISPDISISVPENLTDRIETSDDFFFLKGRAVDSSEIKSVTINGSEIPFLPKTGEFNGFFKLDTGNNELKIIVTDLYNNTSEKQLIIYKNNQLNRDGIILNDQASNDKTFNNTYHAIIIAAQDYVDENIKDLKNPILDAANLKDVLTKYYTFDEKNIQLKINPTRNEIIKSLEDLLQNLGPNDHLLIFYAGHGIFDEKLKRGYWLPSDARLDNKGTWVSNNDIRDYIAGIETKHTLLVTDACFGGSIFEYNREATVDSKKVVSKLMEKKSRTAMTSGLDNVVPDKSVFFQYFLKYLIENPNQYLLANDIFNELYNVVLSNTSNIPQYGVIKDTNHEGGEFIFLRKK